jgi:hypothetical protein
MVSVAVCVTPFAVAPMVTAVFVSTPSVPILKLTEICPPIICTVLDKLADRLLLVRLTAIPLLGAAEASVTVPVTELPPTTSLGVRDKPVKAGGVIVKAALTPFPGEADMLAIFTVDTAVVVTVNVLLDSPSGTTRVAGTTAAALSQLILNAAPPAGAAVDKVSVAVELVPPRTVDGLSVSEAA